VVVVRIGELADLAGVTTKTVRYYESIGLVAEPERTDSGYRNYGTEDVERLRFVRDAQATGLSLAEISSILELKDRGSTSCSHTVALLERHMADLDDQILRLQQARQDLSALADRAAFLDPSSCTDPNRCQVIASAVT
jgi:DNA-binding transcriptional MerR regulator